MLFETVIEKFFSQYYIGIKPRKPRKEIGNKNEPHLTSFHHSPYSGTYPDPIKQHFQNYDPLKLFKYIGHHAKLILVL